MNKKQLLRDFFIANIAGGAGTGVMFIGRLLQMRGILPDPPCTFYYLTHLYCPGCGGTRALMLLLNGHPLMSLRYNPAVLLGLSLIIYYEVTVLMTIFSKKGKVYYTRKMWPVYVYLVVLVLYFVLRDVLLAVFHIDLL
jgi:hypothetical protein